ncbi:hypothetical protein OIE69_44475 (plasmid) [Actinacidiphila glaucinigra]|uniref:hypothetical protein n=1 Tax=Actinacidiphila glaucinigra TaxID=235986 RepID=UPI002DD85092|nr:hypothetical protein [Actinacidiphila glaucinigra]WSD65751.1 hypothetical protein OIE69_43375 [Actinacidiphila glaucinigra]WSD65961.1 hypothetical protein OIE69_44475 [Actinacidiphila glaucinigra]
MLPTNDHHNMQVRTPSTAEDRVRRLRRATTVIALALLAAVVAATSGHNDASVFLAFAQSYGDISESLDVLMEEFGYLKKKVKAKVNKWLNR